MRWPNCQNWFDSEVHTPRILIKCGHTMCEQCIMDIILDGAEGVKWPECKTINEATSHELFPKNFALIQLNQAEKKKPKSRIPKPSGDKHNSSLKNADKAYFSERPKHNSFSLKPDTVSDKWTDHDVLPKTCEVQWKFHDKPVQAFCSDDQTVVCIDCILSEEHIEHKILAINFDLDKAIELQNKTLVNQKQELWKIKMKLISQREEVENNLKISTDSAIDKSIIDFFDNIRAIIDQRERAVRDQITQQKSQIKLDNEKDLKYIQNQLNLVANCEKTEPVNPIQSADKLVEFLEQSNNRQQMFEQVKEPNNNTFKIHEKPSFNSVSEIDNLWSLIKDERADIVPEKEKSVSKSRKTFYNRPMPKTTSNLQKSWIPKINKSSITDVREKKARNISSFTRKNSNTSACKHPNSGLNRSTTSASVSHRAYTTGDGSKHKIRPELEEKFTSGILPPKQPNLKSKHNFKGKYVSGKSSPIQDSDKDAHGFHSNLLSCDATKKLNFENTLKHEVKDFKSFVEEFTSKAETDDYKSAQVYKTTSLKKSASVLRSKNVSCSLIEKRNMRKQEKQDSVIRESIDVPDQFTKHIGELQKVANNTLDKCRRNNLLRNSSQSTILSNSVVYHNSEYADRRYENHSNILSKITKNLKSVRNNKENNNFEFSTDIIAETESECLGQSSSIVDLRKSELADISLNQMSPIKNELKGNAIRIKNNEYWDANIEGLSSYRKNM